MLLAGWIARREFRRRSMDPELAYVIAVWAVPFGLIGARLYHVLTDWDSFSQRLLPDAGHLERRPVDLRRGAGRHARLPGSAAAARTCGSGWWPTASPPASILAQALGRWGNYFNQELYGKPTDLPWGLKIDPAHRVPPYHDSTTFHPMFLYESLLNLAVFGS